MLSLPVLQSGYLSSLFACPVNSYTLPDSGVPAIPAFYMVLEGSSCIPMTWLLCMNHGPMSMVLCMQSPQPWVWTASSCLISRLLCIITQKIVGRMVGHLWQRKLLVAWQVDIVDCYIHTWLYPDSLKEACFVPMERATEGMFLVLYIHSFWWSECDGLVRQHKSLTSAFSIAAIRELTPIFYNSAHKVIFWLFAHLYLSFPSGLLRPRGLM